MPPLELWAYAFAWTLLLEVPVVALGTHRRLGLAGALGAGAGLQVLTHPALWYVVPRFEPYALWWACAELGVVAVEGVTLTALLGWAGAPRREAISRGFGVALAANLVSALLGLLLV